MSEVRRTVGAERMRQNFLIGGLKGIHAWALVAAQRGSLNAPVKTSHLANSIHAGEPFVSGPASFSNDVGTNVVYARAQEIGSGIHALDPAHRGLILIEAKRGKSLAFKWPGGPAGHPAYDRESGLFFFRRVWHPGVKPKLYLTRGIRSTIEDGTGRRLFLSALLAEMKR